jgi:hypothetical protein
MMVQGFSALGAMIGDFQITRKERTDAAGWALHQGAPQK